MYGTGYLPFEEAYHIYSSYFLCDPDKQAFGDKVLDPIQGLNICIVSQPGNASETFVLLKESLKMEKFLVDFTNTHGEEREAREGTGLHGIDYDTVNLLLKSMDTEYDKNVLRTVLALSHTRPELYDLGIDPTSANRRIRAITEAAVEYKNALIAGEDLIRVNLLQKQEKLQQKMKEAADTMNQKQSIWPEKRVKDLEESVTLTKEKLNDVQTQLMNEDSASIAKTRKAAKRRAESLLDQSRIKRRKLGAGRPTEMDEDEEEFWLKAVEEMATAHGRRHDTVMYLHHRVKAKDMLKLVNQRRVEKGKKPLRAVSTVLARGDNETELTHHQRAHVRNAIEDFCQNEDDRKYALIKSMDDKAYVRPGTSVGLRDVKRGGIFQPCDSEVARKLPKYDWVNEEVYVTPSTHRIFTKEPQKVGNKKAYVMSDDESFVFMSPKAQVGSSGTVWSSQDYELRATRPDFHEVTEASSQFTLPFRSFVTRVKDKVKHFVESTTEVDLMAVTSHTECPFRAYEGKRLTHTSDYLERAIDMANVSKMTAQEIKDYSRILGMVQSALRWYTIKENFFLITAQLK